MTSSQEVTQLLVEWSHGDHAALDRLIPLVYAELHRIAARYIAAQRATHTLQTTALIHEAYLRMAHNPGIKWENRAHFLAVAAKAMRHILVDYARARNALRRGGDETYPMSLDRAAAVSSQRPAEIVALDNALITLAQLSPRQSQVVELRYFGGLTNEEIAEALKISPETVMRDWRSAKAWLYVQLNGSAVGGAQFAT
jgi:RNA polymerase sigma factor (TIGR02999 family)